MTDQKPGYDEQYCPSCRYVVNEKAPHCPNCGHPIATENDGSTGSEAAVDLGYETIEEKRDRRIDTMKQTSDEYAPKAIGLLKTAVLWGVGLVLLITSFGTMLGPTLVETLVVGPFLFIVGALLLPPIHGRVGRDAAPTTFGSRRTVEERSVVSAEEPCVACSGTVEEGIERTRQSEFLVAGGIVRSTVEGRNLYCRSCAEGDVDRESGQTVTRSK